MAKLKRNMPARIKGFTLIEILFAIAITSVALLSLIAVFEYQQQVYSKQSDLARLQANLRSGMQFIARDIRMAGFTGIALGFDRLPPNPSASFVSNDPSWPVISLKNGSTILFDLMTSPDTNIFTDNNEPLTKMDGATVITIGDIDDLVDNGDIIEIWGNFTRNWTTFLQGGTAGTISYPAGTLSIYVTDPDVLINAEWILVGDFGNICVHRITSFNSTSGKVDFTPGLSVDYSSATTIVCPYFRRVYFVNTQNIATQGSKVGLWNPQLIRRTYIYDIDANTSTYTDDVIADYISELQVEYIITTDTNEVDDSALIATDPCLIRGIRITLTAASSKATRTFGSGASAQALPTERQLSQVVRVRNLGIQKMTCPIPM